MQSMLCEDGKQRTGHLQDILFSVKGETPMRLKNALTNGIGCKRARNWVRYNSAPN